MSIFFTILIVALLVILVIRLFKKPIRFLFKLLFNTILGYIALILINHFGMYVGLSLPITLLRAVIVGFLGVPGVILLLLVHIFLLNYKKQTLLRASDVSGYIFLIASDIFSKCIPLEACTRMLSPSFR